MHRQENHEASHHAMPSTKPSGAVAHHPQMRRPAQIRTDEPRRHHLGNMVLDIHSGDPDQQCQSVSLFFHCSVYMYIYIYINSLHIH